MLRAIPSVTALLFASVALAAPRSIDDCESIKEPDAYNRCLAAFGPVRGGHVVVITVRQIKKACRDYRRRLPRLPRNARVAGRDKAYGIHARSG